MKKIFPLFLCLICCSLFAKNAVYTVVSKTDLNVDDAPKYATYEFEQTGSQKERMTAGTTTTLQLKGYGEATIQAISLSMKSNKQSGSGWLRVTADGKEIWSIDDQSFDSPAWNGEYSTKYVEITKMFFTDQPIKANTIKIYIESTENSIYINQFTIAYTTDENNNDDDDNKDPDDDKPTTPINTQEYLVSFITHVDGDMYDMYAYLTENQYLVVPDFDYNDGYWDFMGWTEEEYDTVSYTGFTYFPNDTLKKVKRDMTLHACYRHRPQSQRIDNLAGTNKCIMVFTTTSQNYFIAKGTSTTDMIVLPITEQNIATYSADSYIFNIKLQSDSTVYIENNGRYVCASGIYSKVTKSVDPYTWHFQMLEDGHFQFYAYIYGKKMLLYSNGSNLTLVEDDSNKPHYWQLFDKSRIAEKNTYTSYPQGRPTAIIPLDEQHYFEIIGSTISNPLQYQINIFSPIGQLVYSTRSVSFDLQNLNKGLYILNIAHQSHKIIVR